MSDNTSLQGPLTNLITDAREGRLALRIQPEEFVYIDRDCERFKTLTTELPMGWAGPSSVRIAPGGDGYALYVTSFDGTLRRLQPPADVKLTPVRDS